MPDLFLESRREGHLGFLAFKRGYLLLTCHEASWQDTHEQADKKTGEIQYGVVDMGEQT